MLLSRCHKGHIDVLHDYYVCVICGLACDTIFSPEWNSESHDDTRNAVEASILFG